MFRCLPAQPPSSHFVPLQTARGEVVLYPVFVFRLLRSKAKVVYAEFIALCKNTTYKTIWRIIDVLFDNAGVDAPSYVPPVNRPHSGAVPAANVASNPASDPNPAQCWGPGQGGRGVAVRRGWGWVFRGDALAARNASAGCQAVGKGCSGGAVRDTTCWAGEGAAWSLAWRDACCRPTELRCP